MNHVTPRLAATFTFLATCALLAASPASAQLSENPPQHRLSAASHGVTVTTPPFTFCRTVNDTTTGQGVGVCGDGIAAPTPTRVPVHPGGSVEVVVGAPTSTFSARYAAAGGAPVSPILAVQPLDASRQRFAVALPASPLSDLLLLSTTYSNVPGAPGTLESGDAFFSIGLREHRHVKPKPDGITASARLSCRRTASGGRRCVVSERGTIRRPAAAEAVDCRGARMVVRVFVRGRRVLRATVPVTADCRYRLQGRSFSLARGNATAVVRTRFLGSSSLAGRSAPAIRIRVR